MSPRGSAKSPALPGGKAAQLLGSRCGVRSVGSGHLVKTGLRSGGNARLTARELSRATGQEFIAVRLWLHSGREEELARYKGGEER